MNYDLTSECHVKSIMIRHYFQSYSQKTQLKYAVFVDRNSMSLPFKTNHVILHLSITPNFNLLQYMFIIFPISQVLKPLLYTFHKPITFLGEMIIHIWKRRLLLLVKCILFKMLLEGPSLVLLYENPTFITEKPLIILMLLT